MNVGEGQSFPLLSLSLLFSLWPLRRTGVEIPTSVNSVRLHVCIRSFMCFFFFLLTSQTFCHHLILKLERKGMEERIANMRGFWKFPFYGTRVFLKNSSLSVVFCDFGENHLPSPTSVLFKSDLMPALFSLFSSALFRIRG